MKMWLWNCRYNLDMEVSHLDFKTGIEALQKQRPIKAIFLGTRLGDPDTVGSF
jgi:FAD synthetase